MRGMVGGLVASAGHGSRRRRLIVAAVSLVAVAGVAIVGGRVQSALADPALAPTVTLSADHTATGAGGSFKESDLNGEGMPHGLTATADGGAGSGLKQIDCSIDGGSPVTGAS